MPRVNPVQVPNTNPEINKVYDEFKGRLPMNNMKLTLLNSPVSFRALAGFHDVLNEVKSFAGEMDANLFCYAISQENDCFVCSEIFRDFLEKNGVDYDSVIFTPRQQALISFGRNVADNPHEVFDDQIEELREFFDEEQLVAVTSLAAMMVASNIINTVLDVEL